MNDHIQLKKEGCEIVSEINSATLQNLSKDELVSLISPDKSARELLEIYKEICRRAESNEKKIYL